MRNLFRKKPITHYQSRLKRVLTSKDLTLLGIGAIIGAGIFVLTGIAAATKAGPAVIFCFMLAGVACTFSALSYAELASSIGGSGSAYGYVYAGFGELLAWIIGWDLLLEYGIACSTVAIGWAGYVSNALKAVGITIPSALSTNPFQGGIVDLPAMLIVLILTAMLAIGIHQSAKLNKIMVYIKLSAILLFIGIAFLHIDLKNWQPFMPFGWTGIVNGAALLFFAYIGFDAVSTAAEESVNPQRDLPRGILFSLAICTLAYMLVAGLLTIITPYQLLNVSSPVATALLHVGFNWGAGLVAIGAITGLTSVILVMFYGLTRVSYAMARDGLLPSVFSYINPHTSTPVRAIIGLGIMIALIAGFVPMENVAELVNIGTLAAFCLVCGGVAVMRYTQPNLPRPFKAPFSPLLPILGILSCFYLMLHLSATTWTGFLIWTLIGLVIYFGYGRKHSVLAKS